MALLNYPSWLRAAHFFHFLLLSLLVRSGIESAHPRPCWNGHGPPLRLRVETQLGFTMAKYICAIEFISDYKTIGRGQGGWQEDFQYFSQEAGI